MKNKFETLSYIFFIAGAFTLLPFESSELNFFGYKSLCSFAPLSTFILLCLGGITIYVDSAINKESSQQKEK